MPRTFSRKLLIGLWSLCVLVISLFTTHAQDTTESSTGVVSTGNAWQLDAATYAGGPGDDNANAMALGSDGALYVAINSSVTPTSDARDLRAEKGESGSDIVLRKYRAGGTDLEWTLLLGGGGSDVAHALVLDRNNNIYLCGSSDSARLTNDASDTKNAGARAAFALKIEASGERIAWNRWFNGQSTARTIALDGMGAVWLGGDTNAESFVATKSSGEGGRVDGWVAQLDAAGQWSRALRIGGTGNDFVRALSFDEQGALWLCGDTDSRDFPTLPNAITRFQGANDAWLARFSPDLGLESVNFWGGTGDDFARALAIRDGRVVIAGFSSSARDDNLRAERVGTMGRWDAFFAQTNAVGDDWSWSQIWGGSDNDFAAVLALDWRGAIVVGGHQNSTDFPAGGQDWKAQTLGARGGIDSWLLRLEAEADTNQLEAFRPADALIFGGSGDDWLRGLVLGRNGVVATGQTSSDDLPLARALQPKRGGATDAFALWLRGQNNPLTAFAPESDFPNDPTPSDKPPIVDYPIEDYPSEDYPRNDYPRYPDTNGGYYPGDYYPDPYPSPYPYPAPYPYPVPYPYPRPRPGEYGGPSAELKLRIDPQTVSERAGGRAVLGEVWRNTRRNETLVLSLESNCPDRVRVPSRLVIGRGQSSATFWIDVLDNNRADGDVKVYISVRNGTSYYNFGSDAESLRILDDEGGRPEKPDFNPFGQRLALRIEPQRLERAGANAARGRVIRGGDLSRPLRVYLTSSAPNLVRVPAQVLIEARQDNADFSLDVAPEAVVSSARNPTQNIQIRARADNALETTFTLVLGAANLPVPNRPTPNRPEPNRNFRLEVTITPNEVRTGISEARGRVRRSGALDAPLVVTLNSSDANLVRVPPQITIPAGRDGVDFRVALNAAVRTGASTAVVEASALGQRDTTSVRFQRVASPNTPAIPIDPVRPAPNRPFPQTPPSVPAPPIIGTPQRRPAYRPNPAPVQTPAARPEPPRVESPTGEPERRPTFRRRTPLEKLPPTRDIERENAQRKAAQEAAQREAAQREAAQREAAQREAAQREAAQRENERRRAAQESAQRDNERREAAQKAAQREEQQREAARREASRREAEKREAARRDTQRLEAALKAAQERAREEQKKKDAAPPDPARNTGRPGGRR